jgi:hypothetical protein
VTNFLLALAGFTLPVLLIVGLAVLFNRRLSASCGGLSPDGRCGRCGRTGEEIQVARGTREDATCP